MKRKELESLLPPGGGSGDGEGEDDGEGRFQERKQSG